MFNSTSALCPVCWPVSRFSFEDRPGGTVECGISLSLSRNATETEDGRTNCSKQCKAGPQDNVERSHCRIDGWDIGRNRSWSGDGRWCALLNRPLGGCFLANNTSISKGSLEVAAERHCFLLVDIKVRKVLVISFNLLSSGMCSLEVFSRVGAWNEEDC